MIGADNNYLQRKVMANYKLLATVAAVSTLGMSTLALAEGQAPSTPDNSGVYVEGQLGYNYFQGDKAYKTNINALSGVTGTKFNSGHFAGRAAVGYQFNQYVALEAAYDYLGNTKYTGTSQGSNFTAKTDAYAFDLAAKGILPLSMVSDALTNANIFAKAGAALVGTKSNVTSGSARVSGMAKRNYKVAPELGGGFGYNLDNGIGLDVSYMHIFGRNKVQTTGGNAIFGANAADGFVPSSNLILAGVSYRFAM